MIDEQLSNISIDVQLRLIPSILCEGTLPLSIPLGCE